MDKPPASGTNAERVAALRIADANFNRASEGLRVVEEYFRFAAADAHLARLCKELRHELAEAMAAAGAAELARSREAAADVGRTISTAAEQERLSLVHVALASWKRVEQALRVLEEYGKLLALDAAKLEQLRYRAYTLGKALAVRDSALERLAGARLYVLIDGGGSPERFDEAGYRRLVGGLVAAGVLLLQLRDKALDDMRLLERARIVRELTAGSGTLFIMNDRADLAVAALADGVHLGQEDLPVYDARRIVGTGALIGVSTHNIEQARRAVLDGADYIGCGPTFASETKQFLQFAGLDFLRQVAAEISLPAFAIGGITAQNVEEVLSAGFSRIAVSSAVWNAEEPSAAARHILEKLGA